MASHSATRQKLSRFPSTLLYPKWGKSMRAAKALPSTCFIPRTNGHSGAMGKLIFDNRFVGVAFVLLLFVNAFAITNGWYA